MMYYDGQFDDARLNITLITTAALAGATVMNHVLCMDLIKVMPMMHFNWNQPRSCLT